MSAPQTRELTADDAVRLLMIAHPDKTEQARKTPSLRAWFVGKIMQTTTQFHIGVVRHAVDKAFSQ